MFVGHDNENINKLVKMINSGKNLGKVNNLYPKGSTIGLQIKQNSGEDIYIKQFYETSPGRNGAAISNEKVVLDKYEDGSYLHYIIQSKPIARFLADGFEDIMPIVNPFRVTTSSIGRFPKEGDWIRVSGDGCIENELLIYISPNANQDERYFVGKVKPVYGKWSWSAIIKKKMKALDGTIINIGNGYYDIGSDMDDRHRRISGVINFDEN